MKKYFPFSLTGFLSFAAGCLVAFMFFYQKQGILGMTIGGTISGFCISLRERSVFYTLLASLGFALAALPGAFLIGVSMLGLYYTDGPRLLEAKMETVIFYIFGYTIIGVGGAIISDPRRAISRVVSGIKSFGLVSLCGSIVLESLRQMDYLPKGLALAVALLTYATAGGFYEGMVKRQAGGEKTRLTTLKLSN